MCYEDLKRGGECDFSGLYELYFKRVLNALKSKILWIIFLMFLC